MPKILVSDDLSAKGIAILQEAEGFEVDVKMGMPPEELTASIPDYHGLVIRSATQVTAEVIAAAANMKVIGRAGIGVDNVELDAASAKGIIVMNTPGGNTITTAEHAIAMLMALSRNIPQADHSMKEGKWEKKQFMGVEVFNKTLGIIGLGRVGSIVAHRALGLQMKVLAYDPYIARDVAEKIGVEPVEFDELLARSDYISIHAAKTKDTEGILGAAEFATMKTGVFLINCARGGIVDEEALLEALDNGTVARAALDVFSVEPTPPDSPLVRHPRVICTPHLGASSEEAQENVAIAIAEQIADFFTRGEVRNAVNTPSLDAEVVSLLGPYLNLAERLGSFAAQYVEGGIKGVNIRYAGEEIARGTTPLTLYILTGVLQTFMEEAVNMVNAPYLVKQRGIVVNESTTRATEDYANLITVELVTDKGRGTVSGTIFGRKNPRIVRIDEVSLEAIPEGHILVFTNRDTPGVIGQVGTILGNNEINIAGIQLGRTAPHEDAVAVLNVDQLVTEAVLAELQALPNLYAAKTVTL
ncbi:MAG: phosphoglycerate dehydrogenase [Nitrospinota bacterium]